MADFLVDFIVGTPEAWWNLYIDRESNVNGSGAGIILDGPDDVTLEQALKFNFKASNNQAEYEALIAGLKLAKEVEVKKVRCHTNSQLVQG